MAPQLAGLHHIKIPVTDLDQSLRWYQDVLGAQHLQQFDHHDDAGARYAVILGIPGVGTTIELRWAPRAAVAMRECDPITLAVDSVATLTGWVEHLDSLGADHSGLLTGGAGTLLVIRTPDDLFLRIAEMPAGGVENIVMTEGNPEPDGPWLNPEPMRHP